MIGQGVAIIILAGILGGSVLAPIKGMRRWQFEKSWAVYSIWAYLILPWVAALLTVPHLFSIYPEVSAHTMLICTLCGLGWGGAVILFGVAVNLIGLSLTTAILYGASIAVGSLSPLLISHRDRLFSMQGVWIALADAGIIAGVVLCAWAGKLRNQGQKTGAVESPTQAEPPAHFTGGVIAAFVGAILSSLFNIALAYGGEFNRLAIAHGASPLNAANAQWAITVSFGYIPNLLFTILTFSRRHLWATLRTGPFSYWVWPFFMGAMFIGGTVLYGSGAGLLGTMGPVIGWPMYQSMMIIAGVFWGWVTHEWAGSSRRARSLLVGGMVLQILFICLLGFRG